MPLFDVSVLRRQGRWIAFGFTALVFASFGQTYFIALFGGSIRQTFALSHGEFGFIYACGTLAGGLSLAIVGRLIDRADLRLYACGVVCGLAAGCLLLAWSPSALWLFPTFYLLRLCGQSLMSHMGLTTIARMAGRDRGTALSLGGLGFPAGEALAPLGGVLLAGAIGWRASWLAFAGLLVVFVLPMLLQLIGRPASRRAGHARHGGTDGAIDDSERASALGAAPAIASWTRLQVLRDSRFYLLLPGLLAPSFIITGLFFHQAFIAEAKGWSLAWLATCFIGYALGATVASLLAGPWVDRIGARPLLIAVLPGVGLGALVLALFDAPAVAMIYMVLAGITGGVAVPVVTAALVELYGPGHLGAINAMTMALRVAASAAAPLVFGLMIDAGAGVASLAGLSVGYVIVGLASTAPVAFGRAQPSAAR